MEQCLLNRARQEMDIDEDLRNLEWLYAYLSAS